jgi:hypothetical protein
MLVDQAQLFVHNIANALYQSAAMFHQHITCSFAACDRNHNVTHSTVFGWAGLAVVTSRHAAERGKH